MAVEGAAVIGGAAVVVGGAAVIGGEAVVAGEGEAVVGGCAGEEAVVDVVNPETVGGAAVVFGEPVVTICAGVPCEAVVTSNVGVAGMVVDGCCGAGT